MPFSMSITIRRPRQSGDVIWTAMDSRRVANEWKSLILSRTLEGKDYRYKAFKPYANARTAKGRTHVDLYETGEMLNSMRTVNVSPVGADVVITGPNAKTYAEHVNKVREFWGYGAKDGSNLRKLIDKLINGHLKSIRAKPALGGK